MQTPVADPPQERGRPPVPADAGLAKRAAAMARAYPTLAASAAGAVLGWTPTAWLWWIVGGGYLGPIPVPAIFAMVGVLFAVLSLMHAADDGDPFLRRAAAVTGALCLVRVLVVPLFG